MKLSADQQRIFWRTFKKACQVHCVPRADQLDFRQGLIQQSTGLRSLTQVMPGAQFDALMVAVARAAGDSELIDHFEGGHLKRSAHLAEANIKALLELKGVVNPSSFDIHAYMAGMLRQHTGCHDVSVPNVISWWDYMEPSQLEFLLKASYIALTRKRKSLRKLPQTPPPSPIHNS